MITYSLFIVDDEDTIRRTLAIALEGRYRLADFPDAESAVAAARVDPPDLVLLDIGLPGMSGIEAIPVFKAMAPGILIIVITAYEDVQSVVSAMKRGAYDYVVKPLNIDTLEMSIGNALESIRLKKEVQALQERYLRENLPCFIGESNTIRDVMEFVGLLARSPDTPVLILGETGTGKELIASAIHYRSPNFRGPLISVNCAAIPGELIESELFGYEKGAFSGASTAGKQGMVEQAEGGTLFLDEIGDLSPEAQAKLLRFLEEGEFYRVGGTKKLKVRARVVSATNKNLEELIGKGHFREDLYYRLAVARVELPSLTARRDDIVPIALHFLLEFNRKFERTFNGISREAREALMQYRWKGNVRELRNFVERGVLVGKGPELTREDLGLGEQNVPVDPPPGAEEILHPLLPPEGVDLRKAHESVDKHFFQEALRKAGGNETQAALLLRINYHTFRYRRKKLGL
jgi:DNA-binding NtrC family response regulator